VLTGRRHGTADIHDGCRTYIEPSRRGPDAPAVGETSLHTAQNAGWDHWSTDTLACRQRPCLTGSDGLRQLRCTVCVDHVQQVDVGTSRAYSPVVDIKDDATVVEHRQESQQVRNGSARQVAGISDDYLINLIELRNQRVPTRVLPTPDDPAIVGKVAITTSPRASTACRRSDRTSALGMV
jgi:hypothetical protein